MLNIEGIFGWLASNIIPLGVGFVGLLILFGAKKGRLSEGLSQLMVVLLGLIVFFGAVGFAAFGDQLSGIVISNGPAPEGAPAG